MEETQVLEGVEGQSTESKPSEIEGLRQSVQQKEAEIKRLQGILKAEQKRGVSKAELGAITQRLDSQEEWLAEALDDLARRQGDSYEEPRQERKSYKQSLEEKRQAKPSQTEDPEVRAFFDYIDEQGLDIEDSIVKDAVGDDRPPKQALKFLKEKMKEKEMSEIEAKSEEKIRLGVEQKLKDLGLTAEGVAAPSAPAKDLKSMGKLGVYAEHFRELTEK